MPLKDYEVTATEKFLVETTYSVQARSPKEAIELCRSGEIAYEGFTVLEGDEEWVETLSVEELEE